MSDSPDLRANKEKEAGKRKKGQATDQYKFGVDVPNSEDEQLGHEKWAGGENISLPVDWEDNIKKGKTSKDTYDSFITETFLRHVIQTILTEKRSSVGGSYYDETYNTATVANLHLNKPIKALPSTHKRVNGKDIPVNKQIIDYLKDMGLLV
jgi:hypothetical protein